jgi:hypothetical protein
MTRLARLWRYEKEERGAGQAGGGRASHGQRNGQRGSLVGLPGRTRESRLCTDDRQHGQNEQNQCHMAEPADKTADFVVVQPQIFAILELLLNTPSGSNGQSHDLKCGANRSEHQIIGLLGGIVRNAANQSPMALVILPSV